MAKSFTTAAKEFFGLKDGQKLTGFATELRELSYEEKCELAKMLEVELGTEITVALAKI